jgi:hypothetical protein
MIKLELQKESAPMRFLFFIIFCLGALWLGDVLFFKSRYSNEVWFEINQEAQKISYDIRRWTSF